MKIDVILGLQWGDEGKGKIVDALGPQYDIIARFQGGPNAGHTLEFDGIKHVLHTIPSGIFHKDIINLIGNGVLIDPYVFEKEVLALQPYQVDPRKNLIISRNAHLIQPIHRWLDAALERSKGSSKIGSTLKGIGPAYTDKTARHGLRVGDILKADFIDRYNTLKGQHQQELMALGFDMSQVQMEGMDFQTYEAAWLKALETLKQFQIIASEYYLNRALDQGKRVLAEGAQGTLLDIDFGSYPFVTSSNTTTAGVCTGLGVAPHRIGKVFGIFKAYCTRVGSGPFPTELDDPTGSFLREEGHEFGATTGRPRRCGWLDIPALKYAVMINGVTDLIITKIDVLNKLPQIQSASGYLKGSESIHDFDPNDLQAEAKPFYDSHEGWQSDLKACQNYDSLPPQAKAYIEYVEKCCTCPVSIISTGPNRIETIYR